MFLVFSGNKNHTASCTSSGNSKSNGADGGASGGVGSVLEVSRGKPGNLGARELGNSRLRFSEFPRSRRPEFPSFQVSSFLLFPLHLSLLLLLLSYPLLRFRHSPPNYVRAVLKNLVLVVLDVERFLVRRLRARDVFALLRLRVGLRARQELLLRLLN